MPYGERGPYSRSGGLPTGALPPGAYMGVYDPETGSTRYAYSDYTGGRKGRGGVIGSILRSLFGGDDIGGAGDFDFESILGGGELSGEAAKGKIDFDPKIMERWTGKSTVPEGWTPEESKIPSVSPEDVIKAQKPRIEEEMQRGFASAAQRLGMAGVPVQSGGYATKLGDVARKGGRDLAEIIARYKYGAAEKEAGRKFAADQSALDRSLQEWMKRSGYEFAGDQGDLERSLREWGKYGDWQQGLNRMQLEKSLEEEGLGMDKFRMVSPFLNQILRSFIDKGGAI